MPSDSKLLLLLRLAGKTLATGLAVEALVDLLHLVGGEHVAADVRAVERGRDGGGRRAVVEELVDVGEAVLQRPVDLLHLLGLLDDLLVRAVVG